MDLTAGRAIKLFLLLEFFSIVLSSPTPTTITSPPLSAENKILSEKDNLKSLFGHCLRKKDVSKCLKRRIIDAVDDFIVKDDPISWDIFNLEISLNKNPLFKTPSLESDSSRSFDDVISQKIRNLFESRLVQVKLAEEGQNDVQNSDDVDEARKKKGGSGGGKHGMMMSGIGVMAFLAQLFLSKVAFMSGAALLLAKIALLFSAVTSLKKSSGGGGGGEHVVYSADVGKQGWQRSIHTMSPVMAQEQPDDMNPTLAYRGQSTHANEQYDGA